MGHKFMLDGIEHEVGSSKCCDRPSGLRCACMNEEHRERGIIHVEFVYGGYIGMCEECDASEIERYSSSSETAASTIPSVDSDHA